MTRIVSFVVLSAIVAVIGVLSFRVLSELLLPLFLALLLVLMFRPLHMWLRAQFRGRDRLAAAATTTAILGIVLLPMALISSRAAFETIEVARHLSYDDFRSRIDAFRRQVHWDYPSAAAETELEAIEVQLARLRETAMTEAPLDEPDVEQIVRARQELGREVRRAQGLLSLNNRAASPTPPLVAPPAANDAQSPEGASESPVAGAASDPPPPRAVPVLPNHGNAAPPAPRPEVQEARRAFREQMAVVAAVAPDDPALTDTIIEAEDRLAAFQQVLAGDPFRAWLRSQLLLDRDELHELRDQLQAAAGPWALGTTQVVSSLVVQFALGLFVMTVSLYYFLADGPAMTEAVIRLIPLDEQYQRQLLRQFGEISRAVVLATLLSAVAQGVLAGIGYFFAGVPSVFLLTFLTMVFAMIPFVGAAFVWVLVCLYLLLIEGRVGAAISLAIYGTVFVSMADNVIKPIVLHGRSNLHPLLALLSVLGGVQALGAVGIFVGPMVVSLLQAVLVMLRAELRAMSNNPA